MLFTFACFFEKVCGTGIVSEISQGSMGELAGIWTLWLRAKRLDYLSRSEDFSSPKELNNSFKGFKSRAFRWMLDERVISLCQIHLNC